MTDTVRPRKQRWAIHAGALIAGAAVGLGFAPVNWWPLVPAGVAGMVLTSLDAKPRTALWRGYLFGAGMCAVAFRWVAGALGVGELAALVAWLAVWYALVGLVIGLARRTPAWGAAGIAVWMAGEWACARWPLGGFGWGRLAYTAFGTPFAPLFPLISATGVSVLVVTSGFLLAWVVRTALARPKWLRLVTPVGLSLCFFLGSTGAALAARPYDPPANPGSGRSEMTVAVVQGNVPGKGINALGPIYTMENNHLSATILLAAKIATGKAPEPDFVVWPENSTATDPLTNTKTAGIVNLAQDLVGTPILVGAITMGPGEDQRQTAGLWWTPQGVTATYHKRNLVPFGEWVPWKSVLVKLVPDLAYVGRQSVAGDTPGVLRVSAGGSPLRVGDMICFDVAYDKTFDEMITGDATTGGGAQVVVVQTSNAMFTGTDQMAQQARITSIRALEARREILIATTNSSAGLLDSRGNVVYASQMRHWDAQVFTVPLRTQITPAVALRGWFDLASVAVPMLGALVALAWRVRRGPGHAILVREAE